MGLRKLTFNEILPILENVKHLNDHEIQARCPAHEDKKNSFTMKESTDGAAVCNCFAGCNQKRIYDAIYSRLNKSPEFEDDKPIKAKKDQPRIIARYKYIDENGEIINTKVRKSNKDFYWAIKSDNQKAPLPLFNLKEVIEKNPIFLVEGEKDVLTLKDRGFGATNDKDGFTSENARKYLSGKDIIILPDNDDPGLKYAHDAADKLIGIANTIKMVLLNTLWADIPEKGDVTDYIEHGFSIEQIIEKANTIEEYKKSEDREESPQHLHPHAVIWEEIENYTINKKNQIVYIRNEEERIPLCHGSIIITEEIHNNDGLNDNILFKCDGVTESGKHLSEVIIPAEEFDSLKWISKKWGCSIVPFGSQSTTQRLISGIKLTGTKAPITFQKCHTGFVNENGKPIAYLHSGGSIGNQDVICELSDELQQNL